MKKRKYINIKENKEMKIEKYLKEYNEMDLN